MKKLLLTSLIILAGAIAAKAQAPDQPSAITPNHSVCVGDTVTYSVTYVSNVTYIWNLPAGWIRIDDDSTHSITVIVGTAGNGIITVTPRNSDGNGPANILTVTINPLPIVLFTRPDTICIGETTQLFPTMYGDWTSSNSSVASVNALTGHVIGLSNGTATFTFTASTGCQATTPPVTVHSLPTVSITGSSSICVGATTELSPTTGGTWISNNPAVASVTNAGLVTGLSSGTATFTFRASTGCQATTLAVTVNSLPTVSITGPNTICIWQTTQLFPTTGGTWTSNNPSVASVTNAGLVTGLLNGTATFTFTADGTGCQATTPEVRVDSLPQVFITGPNIICVGATTELSPTTGGTWISNHSAIANVTSEGVVTGLSNGTATFTFTNSTTTCRATTQAVTVNPLPIVSIIGINIICIGQTTQLSPTAGGTWVSSNPSVATVTNAGVVTGVSNGTATFTFTANTGCQATTSTVTVNSLPQVSITGPNTICVGATTELSPTTGGIWVSNNPTIASVTSAGAVTGLSGGHATFRFIASTGCEVATPTITVHSLPSASITGPNTINIGETTQLFPTIGGTWTSSNPSVASVTNEGLVTGLSNGTVIFRFTDLATNCQASTSLVTVSALFQVSITGPNPICIGQTTQLSPAAGGTWVSNHPHIASVTDEGLVIGLSSGTATFTFTMGDNQSVTTPFLAVTPDRAPVINNNIEVKTDPTGMPYLLAFPNVAGDFFYQWYHNGTPIIGANSQFYHSAGGLQAGSYKVFVAYAYSRTCGSFTEPLLIDLQRRSISPELFFLYPNPSDGRFSVVFNRDIIGNNTVVNIGLFSLQGARIMETQVAGSESFEFDENLNSGIYVLRVTTDSNLSETRQIVINN